jgi:ATP-binding cassette subfamily G (WHITE) protein 2 (PDR)
LGDLEGEDTPGCWLTNVTIADPLINSGCSTLLKTISGETDGFIVDDDSRINYQGISMEQMHNNFRGECMYQAEVDVHFPQLTVGQTLLFAAKARSKESIRGITATA